MAAAVLNLVAPAEAAPVDDEEPRRVWLCGATYQWSFEPRPSCYVPEGTKPPAAHRMCGWFGEDADA